MKAGYIVWVIFGLSVIGTVANEIWPGDWAWVPAGVLGAALLVWWSWNWWWR